MKNILPYLVIGILVLSGLGASATIIEEDIYENNSSERATHTALAEYGTATWCGYCKYAHGALKELYAEGQLDFYYVSLVCDMNTKAYDRAKGDFNLYGYPTVWWDGGYKVNIGAGSVPSAKSAYISSISSCGARSVKDVDINLVATWEGSTKLKVECEVVNNEANTYDGTIRVYIVEKESSMGWTDTAGDLYTMAFLDWAFYEEISIPAGETFSNTTTWDGESNGYPNITEENMIIIGDALTELKHLESKSVNCCVTSPPYWNLRDYGVEGQLGLEATPAEYVEKIVFIFREAKRVLRDDGTLWLNLGDSYSSNGGYKEGLKSEKQKANKGSFGNKYRSAPDGLKKKELVGIPWKVAFALQADGWYLRSDIIWYKPNAMPESVKDRPTKSHEYIFLLSKNERYYYDYKSIKEPVKSNKGNSKSFRGGGNYTKGRSFNNKGSKEKEMTGNTNKRPLLRTKRDVWLVATAPFKGPHYATFPPKLIKPCILAGCPENGVVLDPFIGSGTVGKVAKETNRKFIGIDIDPENKPLIDKRIESAHFQHSF